jgi:hypothetical protein
VSDRAPDVAGEIIGYRAWYLDARWQLDPPTLYSINGGRSDGDGQPWPHRDWMVAACGGRRTPDEVIPHESCFGCGIHAARDREHLVDLGYNDSDGLVVIGEVALSGKVIPGDLGWRAQRARPLRLWLPYDRWQLVRRLSEAYGVPVGLTNPLKVAA